MDDAEYVFKQTSMERKRVARGAYNKVRGGGRIVRMPSDRMSKKEREMMNGEMKSYDMGKPMVWADFQNAPHDIQQEYLDKVAARFNGVPNALIAEMFKIHRSTLGSYMCTHGLTVHRPAGYRQVRSEAFLETADGEAFMRWACGEEFVTEEEPVLATVSEPVSEPVIVKVSEKSGEKSGEMMDINNIAVLLRALSGTGAKLTIEITL